MIRKNFVKINTFNIIIMLLVGVGSGFVMGDNMTNDTEKDDSSDIEVLKNDKNKRDNKTGSALSNVTENITNMMVAIIPLIVIVGIMSGIISAMDFNNTKHKPIKMKQKRKVVRKVINETAQIILKEPEVKQITHPMMEDYILIKLGKDMELVLEMERQEKLHPEQECMIEEFLPEFKKEHNLEGHYGLFQQRK